MCVLLSLIAHTPISRALYHGGSEPLPPPRQLLIMIPSPPRTRSPPSASKPGCRSLRRGPRDLFLPPSSLLRPAPSPTPLARTTGAGTGAHSSMENSSAATQMATMRSTLVICSLARTMASGRGRPGLGVMPGKYRGSHFLVRAKDVVVCGRG